MVEGEERWTMSRDYETEDYPKDFEEAVTTYAHKITPFWDKTRFPWKIALFFFEKGKEASCRDNWTQIAEDLLAISQNRPPRKVVSFTPLDPSTLPKVEAKK
jgi:hypothetical protein